MADASSTYNTPVTTRSDDAPPRTPLASRRSEFDERSDSAQAESLQRTVDAQRDELNSLRLQLALSSPQPQPSTIRSMDIPVLITSGIPAEHSTAHPVFIPPGSRTEYHPQYERNPVLNTSGGVSVPVGAAAARRDAIQFSPASAAEFDTREFHPVLTTSGTNLRPAIRSNPALTMLGKKELSEVNSREYFNYETGLPERVLLHTPPDLGDYVSPKSHPELNTRGTFGSAQVPISAGQTSHRSLVGPPVLTPSGHATEDMRGLRQILPDKHAFPIFRRIRPRLRGWENYEMVYKHLTVRFREYAAAKHMRDVPFVNMYYELFKLELGDAMDHFIVSQGRLFDGDLSKIDLASVPYDFHPDVLLDYSPDTVSFGYTHRDPPALKEEAPKPRATSFAEDLEEAFGADDSLTQFRVQPLRVWNGDELEGEVQSHISRRQKEVNFLLRRRCFPAAGEAARFLEIEQEFEGVKGPLPPGTPHPFGRFSSGMVAATPVVKATVQPAPGILPIARLTYRPQASYQEIVDRLYLTEEEISSVYDYRTIENGGLPSRGEKNNYRNANIFDGSGSYLEEKTAEAAIQYFENVAHYIRLKNVYANVMSEPRAIREMTAGFTRQALEWYNTTRKAHPDFLSKFVTFSEAFFNRFIGEFFLKVLCRRLTPNYHTHNVGRGYQSILDFVLEVRQLINRIEIIHSMCTSIRVPIPEPRVIYEMLVVALPSQACEKAKIHIRSMLAFQTVREECDPVLFMETIEKLARESIAEIRLRDPPPVRAPISQPRVASVQEAQTVNENTHEMMQELGTASLEVRYEAVINCLSNISGYEDIEEDAASLEALERVCAARMDDEGSASEGFCVPVIDQHGVLVAMTNSSGKSHSVTCWACGESGHLARDCKKNDGSLSFRPSSSTSAPFKDVLKGKKAAGFASRGKTPFGKSS
jgi:Zinc knuckle